MVTRFLLASCAVLVLVNPSLGQSKREKKENWSVVAVGSTFRVVETSEMKKLEEEVRASDKAALERWNQAKKTARKEKAKFSEPKPKKTKVKKVRAGFASRDEAEAAARKLSTGEGGKPPTTKRSAKAQFVVVTVDGGHRVLEKAGVARFKKDLDKEFKERVVSWTERKKAAKKEKAKFDEPKPQKPKVKVHAKAHATEQAAREEIDKMLKKKS